MNRLVLSLAVAAFAVPALAVDFDNGVDVSVQAGQARAAGQDGSYRPDGRSFDVDCREIRFSAGEPASTLAAALESRELAADCRNDGDCRGRQSGVTRYGGAAVSIRGRKPLLPWETDVFRVCMEGSRVDMAPLETAYEYAVVQQGGAANGWTFVVEPGAKRAVKPDPDGITGRFASGIKVEFTDKWASHYAGQTVEIRYALKQERSNWPDDTAKRGVISAATAPSYSFSLENLRLKAGPKYYIEYSFRRVGPASSGEFTKPRKTETLVYTQAALPQ